MHINGEIDDAFTVYFETITRWHPTTMIDRLPIKIKEVQ